MRLLWQYPGSDMPTDFSQELEALGSALAAARAYL